MCERTDSYVWAHWRDTWGACAWRDSFIMCDTTRVCDMTHSFVRHDWFISEPTDVTPEARVRDVTHFFCVTWLIRATWLIHLCYMTDSYVRHDSFICVSPRPLHLWRVCVPWLILYVWCDSYVCRDSFVWRDSFICVSPRPLHLGRVCVPWLIHYVWRDSYVCRDSFVWRDSFICVSARLLHMKCEYVTWLVHSFIMCDMAHECAMTHSYVWHDHLYVWAHGRATCGVWVWRWLVHHVWRDSCGWRDPVIYVTWLIHICEPTADTSQACVCDVTRSYCVCVWRDSFIMRIYDVWHNSWIMCVTLDSRVCDVTRS